VEKIKGDEETYCKTLPLDDDFLIAMIFPMPPHLPLYHSVVQAASMKKILSISETLLYLYSLSG
jgi:hypothetical protein